MPRPVRFLVCIGCKVEMQCDKNQHGVELTSSVGGVELQPYQIWDGDRYACPGCGVEIVVGFGRGPIAETFNEDYARVKARYGEDFTQVKERI